MQDIIEVILPLLKLENIWIKHRYWQFYRAHLLCKGAINKFEELPQLDMNAPIPNLTVEFLLKDPMFHDWLVGFMEAECSFSISKNRAFWAITQKDNRLVLEAIKIYLGINSNIKIDRGVEILSIESVEEVQKIINFFNNPNKAKLIGYKKDQFNNWCKVLKNISRYKNIII